jgi:hypothetical protein
MMNMGRWSKTPAVTATAPAQKARAWVESENRDPFGVTFLPPDREGCCSSPLWTAVLRQQKPAIHCHPLPDADRIEQNKRRTPPVSNDRESKVRYAIAEGLAPISIFRLTTHTVQARWSRLSWPLSIKGSMLIYNSVGKTALYAAA